MSAASVLSPQNLKEWLTFTSLDADEARRMALALLDDRETLRADRDRLASLLREAEARDLVPEGWRVEWGPHPSDPDHDPHAFPCLVPLSDTPHEERRSAMNDDPECRHGESLSGPPCADCLTGGPFISRTRPLMGPPKTEDPDA